MIKNKLTARILAAGLSAVMLLSQAQVPVMADLTEEETVFADDADVVDSEYEETLSAEEMDAISGDVEAALLNMKQVRQAAEEADREVPVAAVQLPESDTFGEHIDLSPEGIAKLEMTEEEYLE
ncbi:MAG: hypothetical protein IK078_09750, partial [Lachnospiraceae bacterium]|nr:hypothetical protein [Lachnospiraceae bacterium]